MRRHRLTAFKASRIGRDESVGKFIAQRIADGERPTAAVSVATTVFSVSTRTAFRAWERHRLLRSIIPTLEADLRAAKARILDDAAGARLIADAWAEGLKPD